MDYYYPTRYYPRHRYYDRCCDWYDRPYYPRYYGGVYGSQIGYIDQNLYNAGYMAGVNQIATVNNIGRPYYY